MNKYSNKLQRFLDQKEVEFISFSPTPTKARKGLIKALTRMA